MTDNNPQKESIYPNSSSSNSTDSHSSGESIPPEILNQLKKVAGKGGEVPDIADISSLSGCSHEVMNLNLADGRVLMLKRSPYDWAGPRFCSARRASKLLRKKSSVIVPKHIPLSDEATDKPLLAYWYISLPTLEELWPTLSSAQRAAAVRSAGDLLHEVHEVQVDGYGPLSDAKRFPDISSYMVHDLRNRLELAIWENWPDALPLVDQLAQIAGNLPSRPQSARLIHNDIHLDNILCEVEGNEIQCVGLLDLEAAQGSRPEADLAVSTVLHDPLFAEEHGKGEWLQDMEKDLLEGYGKEIDQNMMQFFQIYHLINLGFFSALNGDHWHADKVASAVRKKLKAF